MEIGKRKKSGATNRQEKRMRADKDKRLGEFMDAFVSCSGSQPGSASVERKAAEAISVSTVNDPSEILHVDVHTVMPVESVAATTVYM